MDSVCAIRFKLMNLNPFCHAYRNIGPSVKNIVPLQSGAYVLDGKLFDNVAPVWSLTTERGLKC
jgi:hypothetical protein